MKEWEIWDSNEVAVIPNGVHWTPQEKFQEPYLSSRDRLERDVNARRRLDEDFIGGAEFFRNDEVVNPTIRNMFVSNVSSYYGRFYAEEHLGLGGKHD